MKKGLNKARITAACLATIYLSSLAACTKKDSDVVIDEDVTNNPSNTENVDVMVNRTYEITLSGRDLKLNDEQYNELLEQILENEKLYNRELTLEESDDVTIQRYYSLNVFGEEFTLSEKEYLELVKQLLINSVNEVSTIDNTNDEENQYEVLTDEKFNELVMTIKEKFAEINLAVSNENIKKFAMIINIDKLAKDNKELIYNIIGEEDPTEVFADADEVISTMMTYNYEYYYDDEDAIIKAFEDGVAYKHDVQGFVKLSDFIFDNEQKEIVMEIESRINEIADSVRDNEKMNKLVYKLLTDLISSTSRLSMLEDGVNYATEWLYIELIRGMFGMDLEGNITLDATNFDLVKYYVSYADDSEEYTNNSSVNGSVKNINALLNDCKTKTLTK